MHVHFLGIGGTLMGNLALLAKQLGHQVSGADSGVYPPMSDQLHANDIHYYEGYSIENLTPKPDLVVIGNALSRGNITVESILAQGIPYTSGAQWLADDLLRDRWVLAVAGTHGKTTTASMLAWILDYADLTPGFLIGGVPSNFTDSARVGSGDYFVVEADEYDTAFFDKRSKFVHYHPKTLIINNLEFDHADIFPDLAAIQTQFHHLIRTVPNNGLIIYPESDINIAAVIERGCWAPLTTVQVNENHTDGPAIAWQAHLLADDGSSFIVSHQKEMGVVQWPLNGVHNVHNGLSAMAAAHHVGVPVELSSQALSQFAGVKRRLEIIGEVAGVTLYDDFAHHPTAIEATLTALRKKVGKAKITAVIEPRSNTMQLGIHQNKLYSVCDQADQAIWFKPADLTWDLAASLSSSQIPITVHDAVDDIVAQLVEQAQTGDHIVIMSNGGFGGIHNTLKLALQKKCLASL